MSEKLSIPILQGRYRFQGKYHPESTLKTIFLLASLRHKDGYTN